MLEQAYTFYVAIRDLVDAGGPVVWWILFASVALWTLVAERFWYFTRTLPRQTRQALAVWQARREHRSWRAHKVRERLISTLATEMNANMPLLRVLVPLSPLLGLLGTVVGMLEVFDAIAARGQADARTLASGVSQAMVCTMAGLSVSIAGLFPVFYFRRRARREAELLADKFTY